MSLTIMEGVKVSGLSNATDARGIFLQLPNKIDHAESKNKNVLFTAIMLLMKLYSGQKDKVSQKKKVSIKPKNESSPLVALVEKNENRVVNSFKDNNTSR